VSAQALHRATDQNIGLSNTRFGVREKSDPLAGSGARVGDARPVANARDTSGVLGQPCGGFQSAEGMTLTIHGTPNLSMREPKPGDQKVSPNGMACLPPSDS
jgi:hypothetical protein